MEASWILKALLTPGLYAVSIHTLHELEARGGKGIVLWIQIVTFPFIRFTNWKQEGIKATGELVGSGFHSYASRIGSKERQTFWLFLAMYLLFPFIRFTNWKQAGGMRITEYKVKVSIHTLHELEASTVEEWHNCLLENVSIHTLHELEARRCQ